MPSALDRLLNAPILKEDRPEIVLQNLLPEIGSSGNGTLTVDDSARLSAVKAQLVAWINNLSIMQQKIEKKIPTSSNTVNNILTATNKNVDFPAFSVTESGTLVTSPPELLLAPQINENLNDLTQALSEISSDINPGSNLISLEEMRIQAVQDWHASAQVFTGIAYNPLPTDAAANLMSTLYATIPSNISTDLQSTIENLISALRVIKSIYQIQALSQQKGWQAERDNQLRNLKQAVTRTLLRKLASSAAQWETKLFVPLVPIIGTLTTNNSISSKISKPLVEMRKNYLRGQIALEQQTIAHYNDRQQLLDPSHWEAPSWIKTIDLVINLLQTIDNPNLLGREVISLVQNKLATTPQSATPLVPDLFSDSSGPLQRTIPSTPTFVSRTPSQ